MVDKAVRVQDLATLHSVQRRPVAAVFESALTRGELGLELGNAPGLALRGVVPGVVDLQEDPLRPVVEVDVRRRDRAALVVAQAQTTQLTLHVRDVRLGRGARMRARLHRVLLGRQTERVVTEGVQDVAPLHAVVPREDVGGDVPERVAHVQTRTRRVREHVLHEQLVRGNRGPVRRRQRPHRVGGVEGPALAPQVLPALLDPAGELRGVAVLRRRVVGG